MAYAVRMTGCSICLPPCCDRRKVDSPKRRSWPSQGRRQADAVAEHLDIREDRSARGLGAGSEMIARCLEATRSLGFRRCYLETLSGMDAAKKLYLRTGFTPLDAPLGNTGHGGCNAFYLLEL